MSIDRGHGIATSSVLADSYDLDALIADTEAAKVAALAAQAAAETAETNSATSATASAASAASITGAEAATAASAAAALVSENNAQSSENDAETAQVAAETAKTAAELAETNAETAETAAEAAQASATASQTSATASQTSATASATSATASATSATASAASAASSASGASSSATDAQSSKDDAATSETNASNSATASASSATSASGSATTATTQATNAATSATTATTQATNASTSATTATTQAGIATTKAGEAATSAANSATSATASATSATNAAASASEASATLNGVLAAYNNTSAITGNAVDVFIYDTSNDSDGGAWRKRTQATSWYNETLNTATRGSRKDFPSVAVIVAESNKVTIYDGDTPDLDMWFKSRDTTTDIGKGVLRSLHSYNPTCVSAKDGKVFVGINISGNYATNEGLHYLDFVKDEAGKHTTSSDYAGKVTPLTAYPNTNVASGSSMGVLISADVNDVAMTVLPNAPIDSTTGLPIPTIAVATDGGVSVIKDDGSVVDLTLNSAAWSLSAFVTIDNAYVTFGTGSGNADSAVVWRVAMPSADQSWYEWEQDNGAYLRPLLTRNSASGAVVPRFLNLGSVSSVARETFGSSYGLTTMVVDNADHRDSLHSYITSTYNSGYMTGDIKGAWLSDTDTTNVVGTEILSPIDFTTGWDLITTGTASVDANTFSTTTGGAGLQSGIILTVGVTYVIDVVAVTSAGSFEIRDSTGGNGGAPLIVTGTGSGTFTSATGALYFRHTSAATTDITSISLRLAEEDRSVNNNGLQVNGTITKTPVATGADLVAYSGFYSSNTYLEQPYNADLDLTTDMSISYWIKGGTNSQSLMGLGSATRYVDQSWHIYHDGGLDYRLSLHSDGVTEQQFEIADAVGSPNWQYVTWTLSGGIVKGYLDGVENSSAAFTGTLTTQAVTKNTLRVGKTPVATAGHSGSLALVRISATAPTAAQILEIYEAEKPLFQENAKCTLNGTSDAVQCLAYDDSTELLHVGTSGGRSTFQGLRRVDETATNTTEISAQGGMIIEETA